MNMDVFRLRDSNGAMLHKNANDHGKSHALPLE